MNRSALARSTFGRIAVAVTLVLAATTLSAQAPPATPAPPAAAPAAPAYLATHAEALQIGRATIRAVYTGQVDSLVATADPGAATVSDIRGNLTDGIAQVSLQLGAERRMISERVMLVEGRVEYWRTAEYELVPVPLIFRVIMGAKGTWRGFTASTEETTPVGEEMKP